MNNVEIQKKANNLRLEILRLIERTGQGYVSSTFSSAEILAALYYGNVIDYDLNSASRDYVISSRGHIATLLYIIWADLGYFPKEYLDKFGLEGGKMGILLQHSIPGAEVSTGSLGGGIGIGCGIAFAAKRNREEHLTIVICGDSELHEGSNWESIMFAAHHDLNNLIIIVDNNHMGSSDFTENVIGISSLTQKFEAFGWDTISVDGHDVSDLLNAFKGIKRRYSKKPLAIIADTVKAKGLPHVENTLLSHVYLSKGDNLQRDIEQVLKLQGGDAACLQ